MAVMAPPPPPVEQDQAEAAAAVADVEALPGATPELEAVLLNSVALRS
eukprot:SAG11_NODE_36775_length_260_cov_0.527950_1_plen_48_part_10